METTALEWIYGCDAKLSFAFLTKELALDRLRQERRHAVRLARAAKEFLLEFAHADDCPIDALKLANEGGILAARVAPSRDQLLPMMVDLYVADAGNFCRFRIEEDGTVGYLGRFAPAY